MRYFIFIILLPLVSCYDFKGCYDSDYIVINKTDETIVVHSSAYAGSGGSQTLSEFTDQIAPNASFLLRNIDAKEDARIYNIFNDVVIVKGNIECTKDELDNALWSKISAGDDKFMYILAVDSTFFQ
jgi:hypothetical protein